MNTPQPAALPRARVMYLQPDGDCAWMPPCDTLNCTPCSVRPHRTLSAAKRAAKWANLSPESKLDHAAKFLFKLKFPADKWASWYNGARAENCRQEAKAILTAIGELP